MENFSLHTAINKCEFMILFQSYPLLKGCTCTLAGVLHMFFFFCKIELFSLLMQGIYLWLFIFFHHIIHVRVPEKNLSIAIGAALC